MRFAAQLNPIDVTMIESLGLQGAQGTAQRRGATRPEAANEGKPNLRSRRSRTRLIGRCSVVMMA